MREKVFAWLGFHFIWVGLCVPMLRISYFLRVHLEWIDECHWRQSTAYEREWNTLFPILGSVRTHFDERECNFSNDSIFSFLHHRKKSVNFSNLFIFVQSFIHDAPKMSKYTSHSHIPIAHVSSSRLEQTHARFIGCSFYVSGSVERWKFIRIRDAHAHIFGGVSPMSMSILCTPYSYWYYAGIDSLLRSSVVFFPLIALPYYFFHLAKWRFMTCV